MTITVDPACSTCHGSGKIMGGDEYHDCPACRLRSRYATRWCDECGSDQPLDGMVFAKGLDTGTEYAICSRCADALRVKQEAMVEALYRDEYGPDYDRLATYQVEGR